MDSITDLHDDLSQVLKSIKESPQTEGSFMGTELGKLCDDFNYIKQTITKFRSYEETLGKSVVPLHGKIKELVRTVRQLSNGSSSSREVETKLLKVTQDILNLKYKVAFPQKLSSVGSDAYRHSHTNNGVDDDCGKHDLPILHTAEEFSKSFICREIQGMFWGLEINERLCLLSFAVFPENAVIKKRLLMHWWIGECFVNPSAFGENVDEILEKFMKKGLIQPVYEKAKLRPNSFKMLPTVRSSVIVIAKEVGFFEFDDNGNPTMEVSFWNKACLRATKEDLSLQVPNKLESLETLFNVSERFPDFTFKWLSKMSNLKVLYLGRWESTAQRHIEVEDTAFLKDLRGMKQLRLLSFQGISRIEELHSSICKLSDLTILDLRACYNLETLPERIDLLKNLTHLDISECYQLDRIPKKLSSLSNLQVLQGFVISDAEKGSTCTLDELSGLKSLRKLSININTDGFGLKQLISALKGFQGLQSLKVAWGGRLSQAKPDNNQENDDKKKETLKSQEKKDDPARSTTNQERTPGNRKKGNTAGMAIENQLKDAEKKRQESAVLNQEKRIDNREKKGSSTEAVGGRSDRKVDNEIQEIAEAESAARNQDKGETSAGKSMDIKLEKGIGMEKAVAAEEGKKKKKVGIAEGEPKTGNQDNNRGENKKPTSRTQLGKSLSKRKSFHRYFSIDKQEKDEDRLPANLQKLDLECFPEEKAPDWLMPVNLRGLKRLYIRGGGLRSLGEIPKRGESKCSVEILRLKYLSGLKLNWIELKALFPELTFLEESGCPNITFCPGDGYGVWQLQKKAESEKL